MEHIVEQGKEKELNGTDAVEGDREVSYPS